VFLPRAPLQLLIAQIKLAPLAKARLHLDGSRSKMWQLSEGTFLNSLIAKMNARQRLT
jgi:hypothetical protein